MQTLLKEKTVRQGALTVYCETGLEALVDKAKGVASRAYCFLRPLN